MEVLPEDLDLINVSAVYVAKIKNNQKVRCKN